MEYSLIVKCLGLLVLIMSYYAVSIFIFEMKRKAIIKDYQKLLNLKDWYGKMSNEANSSYIIESVEKRGQELINKLHLLNANLTEIQIEQKKLHIKLLEEQKILNQYFENYL